MASGKSLIDKDPVRMLIVGYPGSAKTGSLAALANAGFKVRLLDFEGNYEPLLKFTDEDKLDNIDIMTFQDKLALGQKHVEPVGIPQAFNSALKALKSWSYTEDDGTTVDLGASSDWGSDTVLAVDSTTAMAEASFRRAMKLMNKSPGNVTSAVWGAAVNDFMNALKIMAKKSNGYHLVVLGHLQMIGPEDFLKQGDDKVVTDTKLDAIRDALIPTRLYPRGVTKNSSMVLHKEFSSMVLAKKFVRHGKVQRVLNTSAGEELDLKFPAKDAPDEVPIDTGLATLFEALGAKPPKA